MSRVKKVDNALDEEQEPWNYDLVGNWTFTNQNGVDENRLPNADNEYTNSDFGDDAVGNLTTYADKQFKYDWANRLIEVRDGSGLVASYSYDAVNRRVTKFLAADSKTISYTYFGSQVLEELESGTFKRSYIYGSYVDEPLSMYDGGTNQTYTYLRDRQFSVVGLVDEQGDVVESYRYSAFGLRTVYDENGVEIACSNYNNVYGYTGRRYDEESALWYYRNRMYSPEVGRFLQRDPAGYVDGINLYAYVRNNPLFFLDPYGLTAVTSEYQAAHEYVEWTDSLQPSNTIDWLASKVYESNAWAAKDYMFNHDPYSGKKLSISAKASNNRYGNGISPESYTSGNGGRVSSGSHSDYSYWGDMLESGQAAYNDISEASGKITYVGDAIEQVVAGEYSKKVNGLGTTVQVAAGFTGLDLAADIRDVNHNLSNWEWNWSHAGKTALNVAAFLPFVGTLKYSDEVAAVAKGTDKLDFSSDALKWLNKGDADNLVYYGIKDQNAVYTGITKQVLETRLYQHNYAGKNLDFLQPVETNLTRNQARAVEQYLIENGGANALNKINSISPSHRHYDDAMKWAEQFINN